MTPIALDGATSQAFRRPTITTDKGMHHRGTVVPHRHGVPLILTITRLLRDALAKAAHQALGARNIALVQDGVATREAVPRDDPMVAIECPQSGPIVAQERPGTPTLSPRKAKTITSLSIQWTVDSGKNRHGQTDLFAVHPLAVLSIQTTRLTPNPILPPPNTPAASRRARVHISIDGLHSTEIADTTSRYKTSL